MLQRALTEKRRVVIPLIIALLANVALFALAVYPLSVKVRTAEQRAATAAQERQAAEREHRAVRDTVSSKQRAGEELQHFYRHVLPADFAGARRITYLRLAQLARQANLRFDHRRVEPDRHSGPRTLQKLRITMVLEGEYQNVRRFIHQLETAPEFVVIENVALAQGDQANAPLVLTLVLSTYYRGGAGGG